MKTMYDTGYAKGRKEAFNAMSRVLESDSDSDYGHKTFSLAYLRGLLKQIEEKRMTTKEGYTLKRTKNRIIITLPQNSRELSAIDLTVILQIIIDFTKEEKNDN